MHYCRRWFLGAAAFLALLGSDISVQAVPPIFKQTYSYTNTYVDLKAFNNAADILVMVDQPLEGGYTRTFPALLRDGEMIDLYPTGVPNIQHVWANGISQLLEDGSVYITGTLSM